MTRTEAIKRGIKTYTSDSPCLLGHKAKRYVSSRRCVKCDAISSRQKQKTKYCLAKQLKSLTKSSLKKINQMGLREKNWHTLKVSLIACASVGSTEMSYYNPIPELTELLKAEGLEIKDNKIIW